MKAHFSVNPGTIYCRRGANGIQNKNRVPVMCPGTEGIMGRVLGRVKRVVENKKLEIEK